MKLKSPSQSPRSSQSLSRNPSRRISPSQKTNHNRSLLLLKTNPSQKISHNNLNNNHHHSLQRLNLSHLPLLLRRNHQLLRSLHRQAVKTSPSPLLVATLSQSLLRNLNRSLLSNLLNLRRRHHRNQNHSHRRNLNRNHHLNQNHSHHLNNLLNHHLNHHHLNHLLNHRRHPLHLPTNPSPLLSPKISHNHSRNQSLTPSHQLLRSQSHRLLTSPPQVAIKSLNLHLVEVPNPHLPAAILVYLTWAKQPSG